jgi:hypothetical protein
MKETSAAPLPSPTLQKTNPWIIIVAVIIVVCCGCFGMIGLLLAFGPEILHELGLASLPPILIGLI